MEPEGSLPQRRSADIAFRTRLFGHSCELSGLYENSLFSGVLSAGEGADYGQLVIIDA